MFRVRVAGFVVVALVAPACGPRHQPGAVDPATTTSQVPTSTTALEADGPAPVVADSTPPPTVGTPAAEPAAEATAPVEELEPKLDDLDSLLDDLDRMLANSGLDEGEM